MKKILVFLLACVMLLSFLVSCDDTGDTTGTGNGGDQSESGESGKPEANPASDFEYAEYNGGIAIKKYIGTSKNVIIPSEIDGLSVILIAKDVFSNREDVESVVIPDTVQIIVRWSFYACKNLKTVDFGEGVLEIHEHAFDSCSALEKIILPPKLETIGAEAFYRCSSATEIFIPKTLKNWETSRRSGIFGECTALKTITFEEGFEVLGGWAEFSEATSLEEVSFPKSLKEIAPLSFNGCTALKVATFLGDAPETEDGYVFGLPDLNLNNEFVIYYDPETSGWDETPLHKYYTILPIVK